MDALVLTNRTGKDITTSLIIADVFGKRHDNVLSDIKNLSCSEQFRLLNFQESIYINGQGREMPMHEITKDGFSFLVMGYNGEKASFFKEKFINQFNKHEAMLRDDDYIVARSQEILGRRLKTLEQQLHQKDEQLQLQESVIKQAAPKVEYYNEVLQSDSLIATTVIAKDLGMSAESLNEKLRQLGVQYKVNRTWVLSHKYQSMGYTGTKTTVYKDSNGNEKTSVHTYWTEKGRVFIHSLLKPKVYVVQKQLNIV